MKTYNIFGIDEFKKTIGNNSRLLGIDPGSKNIGFAICDENKKVATPLKVIQKTKFQILLVEINQIIKENEDLIIEDNNDFVVLNKQSGISVQGGTKSKKNLIDIFSKSEIFKDSKPFSVHRLDKDTSGVILIAKTTLAH